MKPKNDSPLFVSTRPDNFYGQWANSEFGMLDGKPFCCTRYASAKGAEEWFKGNRLFLRSVLEKMDVFIETMDKENWKSLVTGHET